MYVVTIENDGIITEIHGMKQKLKSGNVVKGINSIDSFSFSMMPTNAGFSLVNEFKTLVTVYNTAKDRNEFIGRVLYSETTMGEDGAITKNVTCESVFGYFCDSQQAYVAEKNWTVSELLNHIIYSHNSQVEEYKRFVIGEMNVTETNDNLYLGIQRENTWDTLTEKLINKIGGEFRYRIENGMNYLDYLTQVGETKETEIALSLNMKSITREQDPTAYVTRLIPLGGKWTEYEVGMEPDTVTINSGICTQYWSNASKTSDKWHNTSTNPGGVPFTNYRAYWGRNSNGAYHNMALCFKTGDFIGLSKAFSCKICATTTWPWVSGMTSRWQLSQHNWSTAEAWQSGSKSYYSTTLGFDAPADPNAVAGGQFTVNNKNDRWIDFNGTAFLEPNTEYVCYIWSLDSYSGKLVEVETTGGAQPVITITGSKSEDSEGSDTEERLDITSVNGGKNYIDDEEAIEAYGIHVGYVEFADVTEASNLLSKGEAWLAENNKVQVKYSITALDLSLLGLVLDDFEVGNFHPIKNDLLDIDDVARIIKKTIDVCEEVKSTIEIGDNFKTLSDIQREQDEGLKSAAKNVQTIKDTTSTLQSEVSQTKAEVAELKVYIESIEGSAYEIGEGLKVTDNVLSVDTVDAVEEDNSKPITSSAVYVEVGNINTLLATI